MIVIYNSMLSIYIQARKVDEALQLFHSIPSPSTMSFYHIINGFGKIGNVDKMFEMLVEMKRHNIL